MELKNRKTRNGYFRPTHRFIEEHARELGPEAAMVYMALLSHAQGKKIAYPSQRLLAEEVGIAVRTVIRIIQRLKDNGDIWVERRSSNIYHLRDHGWYVPSKVTDSHFSDDTRSLLNVTRSHPNKNQINTKKNNGFLQEQIRKIARKKRIPP